MQNKRYIFIALISMTLISLELTWTRIFSAEFFYTYAFLILSLAVLGIGLGALALRLFQRLDDDKYLPLSGLSCAVSALAGPIIVFSIGMDFDAMFSGPGMIIKLIFIIIILNSAYFFAGIAIARIFKSGSGDMSKIYMADLAGAGFGVLFTVIAMNIIGVPAATSFRTLPLLIGIFIISDRKLYRYLSLGLLLISIFMNFFNGDIISGPMKDRAPVLSTHWDAMAKVKVLDYHPRVRGILIDNKAGSNVLRFDGNYNSPEARNIDFGINAENIFKRYKSCVYLTVGAGGGLDALQALLEGAKEIDAVEINPYINNIMKEGELAKFSGNIYNDPRVNVISEDARAYVRRFKNKFDFILSRSANSYAAIASGSFALAENYLFTTEAIEDYFNALTDSGIVVIEHKTYIPRTVAMAMQAFENMGLENPAKHIAVYNADNLGGKILMLSKKPLSKLFIVNAFRGGRSANKTAVYPVYPSIGNARDPVVRNIIEKGYESAVNNNGIDISPCTDDRPFVAQLGLWKNFSFGKLSALSSGDEMKGYPLSKLMIVIILFVVILIVIPINLYPYRKHRKALPAKSWLYYFILGMAFMMIEVILIQKYTLLIGASSYSLTTILLTLLVASGAGSYFSPKIKKGTAFSAIIILLLIDIFLSSELIYLISAYSMPLRIIFASALTFPLGFFMGMPFPKAAKISGENIDWGFAVNGAGSVAGGASVMLIAFSLGFGISLLCGALMYALSYFIFPKK